jgi:CheY-like chemotaxis protein/HPt (histidine-containing phosphotransfer) domain-containing protein
LKDSASFRLDQLGNPMDVIRAVLERKPALLLLDMNLPGVSGYDIARELRARAATRDLPIIAVTAEEGESARQKCLKAGCSDMVTKPVKRDQLLSLIESCLHSSQHAPDKTAEQGKDGEDSGADAVEWPSTDPLLTDLVPGYLQRRVEDVSKLRQGVEDEDFEEIARIAHLLKGSGASYGFAFLSQLGADIDDAAKSRNTLRIMKSVDTLSSYLNRIQANPQQPSLEDLGSPS